MPTRSTAIRIGLGWTAAAAASGFAERAEAQSGQGIPLHIGSALAESYSNGYYALDMGFFKQAGLDVQLDIIASGGAVTAAVVAGALDIGAGSTTSMSNAHLRGLPIYAIAPGGIYQTESPTTLLVVLKNSPLRTAKDLTGKTIGVTTLRDLTQVAVMAWIDKNGGDAKTARFVEVSPASVAPAVLEGRIDVGFLGEPFLTQNKDTLRILGSAYDAMAKHFMLNGWMSSKAFLDRNPDAAKRFVAAIRQADEWAPHNPKQTAAIVSKYTKVPVEIVASMHRVGLVPALDPALIQPVIDLSAKYETLPRAFPASELFYPGLSS